MTFKKGQSGNPAGKPKGTRSIETLFRDAIKKIADDESLEDFERDLVTVVLRKAREGDMKSMEMYLDRLYGKPKQSVDMTSLGESVVQPSSTAKFTSILNADDDK